MLDKPTLEIDREKNEVTIKCNGDTIKFKDDNVEVTRASKNMMFKPPEITRSSPYQHSQYYINIAAQSVHMTATDVHFTNIARNASWDAREIRAR